MLIFFYPSSTLTETQVLGLSASIPPVRKAAKAYVKSGHILTPKYPKVCIITQNGSNSHLNVLHASVIDAKTTSSLLHPNL